MSLICLPPAGRAAYGLIERPNDFASYLLAIGICNLLLYFAFYIIMKVPVFFYFFIFLFCTRLLHSDATEAEISFKSDL